MFQPFFKRGVCYIFLLLLRKVLLLSKYFYLEMWWVLCNSRNKYGTIVQSMSPLLYIEFHSVT